LKITSVKEANKHVGKKLYWDDIGKSFAFIRSGTLDEIIRNQLSFNGSQDYQSFKLYSNLRTTEE
jgi:hypothetical protein